MNKATELKELVLKALMESGYNLISAADVWYNFRKELIELKPGKYTYYVGKHEITFTKG